MIKTYDELTVENQTNYNNLLIYLMNFALDNGIGVTWSHELPYYAPSVSYNNPGKLIIMNAEWENIIDIPFQLAHEIGHVLLEDGSYYNLACNGKKRGEASANVFAIQLFLNYCQENDFYFETYYHFAKCFCIPENLYYLLEDIA